MTGKGCENYQFGMTVSPLDCMGCGVCVDVCPAPGKALKMMPQESQLAQQEVFDYAVANVGKKEGMMAETTVKGSQFNQPLLEFSGSCAGCAETSYARLITQLYGERMYISNATGCSSIWGGPAATSPYTRNRLSGKGPALGKQPVRGQRRARLRHVSGPEDHPREPGRQDPCADRC